MIKDPQFIVLGAHKSGTSWLFNCLYEHSEILIKDKIDYFYVDLKKGLSLQWYQDHFKKEDSSQKIKGELSTVYFFSKKSAEEIYNYNPSIKLIVLLRNPIERAYSHFLQDIKMGEISKKTSFEDAMKQNKNLLRWGNYKKHLESYLKYFNSDQLHVILFDDIKNNSKTVIQKVYFFLEVNSNFSPSSTNIKINQARIPRNTLLDFYKRKLSDFFKKSTLGEKIWWRLKHSWLTKNYYFFNSTRKNSNKGIDAKTRTFLQDHFKNDISYVQQKLNRNDIKWR